MTTKKKAAAEPAKPTLRTAAQYRAAIKRLNEIANQKADDYSLCSVWDEIVETVAQETGLELEGRKKIYEVCLQDVVLAGLDGSEGEIEHEVWTVIEEAIKARWPDSYPSFSYSTVSKEPS